jgi:uncharacterized protein YjbI with pentapeptide repeats
MLAEKQPFRKELHLMANTQNHTPMKKLIYLYFLLIPFISFAQDKVEATRIIEQINKGESVSYQNAQIAGDLDLTRLQNMKEEKNFGKDSHKSYNSRVINSIRFVNCRFTGNVLAYYSEGNGKWNNDDENATYNAHFEGDVIFENCVFEQQSAFKYTEFSKAVSFQKSVFRDEALFKYSKFAKGPDFSNVNFEGPANFKYTDFPKGVNFAGTSFKEEASFKYAKFTEGAILKNARFNGYADFKYTKFSQPLDISGVSFSGEEDFKYAKVDGKNFTSYVLNNK